MARKQARKRKPQRKPMPKIRIGRILTPLFAVAAVLLTYELSSRLLERPINAVEISGPMQRVSAVEIEGAIRDELQAGFFSADLSGMRERIQELQWIDQAAVARRWPNRIAISVTEQTPAAIWGESGLMNIRGELFVTDNAEHVPAELPRLSGPADRAADVAKRYLAVKERLMVLGIDVRSVHLDSRGAWKMQLSNGIEVRLGRRDVEQRSELLTGVVANIIAARAADIDFVDLRYNGGFTIGWKDGANQPVTDPEATETEMLASRGAG